jgi:Asp-tRNA(Asn)/Glu-tRNA(Gln) amidotransferase A subunit family amidase
MSPARQAGDPLVDAPLAWLEQVRAQTPGNGLPGEVFAVDAGRDTAVAPAPAVRGDELPEPARGLRAGTLSVTGVLESALEHIRATDAQVQAWVRLDEGARPTAARLDEELSRGGWRGPLHGIPVGVKDLVDVAGLPTRAGSRHWSGPGHPAAESDAGVITLLRRAGAVVLGKTTTHEFAFGGTTAPTRNPRDLARIPGGSSGGSAAAVAAGHVPLTVGTDTAGSVRIPASYCGVVGYLPSAVRLPRDGLVPLSWSLDRIGLLTPDAVQLAWACAALGVAGTPATPAETLTALRGLRVGIPRTALDEPIDPAVCARFDEAVGLLGAAGVRTSPVDVPHAAVAIAAARAIYLAESLDFHRDRWARRPELFGADVQRSLAQAEQLGAADYVRAQRIRRSLRSAVLDLLSGVDLLLMPTMPTAAPSAAAAETGILQVGGRDVGLVDVHLRYNVVANLAALPAGTQPMGTDGGGLPLGLQWVGAPGTDDRILTAMTAFEALLTASRPAAGNGSV